MDRRKWFDQSQPQTLQIAVILLYINGVFAVIDALSASAYALAFLPQILEGFAAYGIANDRRLGYRAAIVLSGLFAAFALFILVYFGGFYSLINLVFSVALFVALIHPMSRDYQRIWFK